ncbi:MAG: RNA-binding cell elongation regulator Jag/EloR [Candidatus Izemoplasmataceae bacterium]
MKSISFEAKSLDEAKAYAEEQLRIGRRYLVFDTEAKRSMFGFKKSFTVTAKVDVDLVKLGKDTLETMFKNMDIKATVTVAEGEDKDIVYRIETDENPVLIGKNGKTLDSLQFYIRNLLNIFTDEKVIVLVDIGGYKAQRQKQLEILATKTAKEVARSRVPVKLDPMNAYERRIIHTKLSEWRDVTTRSEGEKQNRHLVIEPKKK